MALNDVIPFLDSSLSMYFGWAGARFPYTAGAIDIVISAPTTWNDSSGYKKVKKLTINAGQTLTINKSPFYIFADEINFGDATSTIDASGLSGSAAMTAFPLWCANGGTKTDGSAKAQGGCGGGMLFIIAGRITGAAGIIKANGGNGYANALAATTSGNCGGQGSLSSVINGTTSEKFYFAIGVSNYQAALITDTYLNSLVNLLGKGGGITGGVGGGSGTGGSGIGGGGGVYTTSSNGLLPNITPNPLDLLFLSSQKCLGGGGGGAYCNTTAANTASGGGGGGSVCVWTHSIVVQPTLQANGGVGTPVTANGSSGVTYFILL